MRAQKLQLFPVRHVQSRRVGTGAYLLARSVPNNSIPHLRGRTLMMGCLGSYTGGNGSLSEVIAAKTEMLADGNGIIIVQL